MVKKAVTVTKKKTTTNKSKTTHNSPNRKLKNIPSSKPKTASTQKSIVYNERIFIENFVNLQHAMTNMSMQFGELSQNITKLLKIFEESAKVLVKSEKQVDSKVGEKIDSLLEQNKTIAKGLVLMEDKLKRQARYTPSATKQNPYEYQQPSQQQPQQQPQQQIYQRQPQPQNFQPQQAPQQQMQSQQGFIPQPTNPGRPKPLPQL